MEATGPTEVDYPFVVITDVHGQRAYLERLLSRLSRRPDWPSCSVVFAGDYVDRGPDVRGTLDVILALRRRHPAPVAAVSGNHDLALVRAAGLDGGPFSQEWTDRYLERYDHTPTFLSYLGRRPKSRDWFDELAVLRGAMPADHRDFLTGLPWLIEAAGHVVLHCGLSPELEQSADEQLAALRERRWADGLKPVAGSRTAEHWQTNYPVWLGADKRLSDAPLPAPGRVQVTGHKPVMKPDVNGVRIRLDTSGGLHEPLTACVLLAGDAPPEFVRSDGRAV